MVKMDQDSLADAPLPSAKPAVTRDQTWFTAADHDTQCGQTRSSGSPL